MYIVKEKITYEVVDADNYEVVKTFAGYEKSQAETFAQNANIIVINEQKKYKLEEAKRAKLANATLMPTSQSNVG